MKNKKELSPAIFLDRDGTINYDRNYLSDVKQLKLYKHIEILEGQNTEYEKRVKELDDLLSPDQTSTEGTVAE